MVSVKIDMDKVREIAYFLSLEPKNYDDLVWLCAEAELRLNQPFVTQILYDEGIESSVIEIDPNLFVTQPEETDIRSLAEKMVNSHPNLQELHWFIAERRYVFDTVCYG
jgi:hypothetical protein